MRTPLLSDPFDIVSYTIELIKTSWTYSDAYAKWILLLCRIIQNVHIITVQEYYCTICKKQCENDLDYDQHLKVSLLTLIWIHKVSDKFWSGREKKVVANKNLFTSSIMVHITDGN